MSEIDDLIRSKHPQPEQPVIKTLVIELNVATGAVSATGPIGEKLLCYGMLDCARDGIRDYNDRLARPKIVRPEGPLPPFIQPS